MRRICSRGDDGIVLSIDIRRRGKEGRKVTQEAAGRVFSESGWESRVGALGGLS